MSSFSLLSSLNRCLPQKFLFSLKKLSPFLAFFLALAALSACQPKTRKPALLATLGEDGLFFKTNLSPNGQQMLVRPKSSDQVEVWDVASGKKIRVLTGQGPSVNVFRYSQNGKYIVTNSEDKTAIVWDAQTGHKIQTIVSDGYWFSDVAISNDGSMLATSMPQEESYEIAFWEVASARKVRTLPIQIGQQENLDFSPDGRMLLSTNGRNPQQSALLFDVASGTLIKSLLDPSGKLGAWHGSFSPNGKRVVLFRTDKNGFPVSLIEVWDVDTSTRLFQNSYGNEIPLTAAFSPDGTKVVTGGLDGNIPLWDATTGELVAFLGSQEEGISSVVFNQTGTQVVSVSFNRYTVWDVNDPVPTRELNGHRGAIRMSTYSPDGAWIGSSGNDQTAILWDAATGMAKQVLPHSDIVHTVHFSPDNKLAITASDDKTAIIWDVATGAKQKTLPHPGGVQYAQFINGAITAVTIMHTGELTLWDLASGMPLFVRTRQAGPIHSANLSPDRRYFAIVNSSEVIELWDLGTGNLVFEDESQSYTSASFSPDGKKLIASTSIQVFAEVSGPGEVLIWDLQSGLLERKMSGKILDSLSSVSMSDDGKWIAAATSNFAILLDVETGDVVQSFLQTPSISTVSFSPDSKKLLVSVDYKGTQIYEVTQRKQQSRFVEGDQIWNMNSAIFSKSGQEVLTVGGNATVWLWDIKTKTRLKQFFGHTSWVNTADFSPDGKRFVTGGGDKKLILWEVEKDTPLRTMFTEDEIISLQFSGDGNHVLSQEKTGRIQLWDITSGTLKKRYGNRQFAKLSSDGSMIALQSGVASFVELRGVQSDLLLQKLESPQDMFFDAAFSLDGTRLVTVDVSANILLWDVQTGMLLKTLPTAVTEFLITGLEMLADENLVLVKSTFPQLKTNGAAVLDITTGKPRWILLSEPTKYDINYGFSSAVLSQDGQTLLTGSQDGTAKLWAVGNRPSLTGGGWSF